MLVLILMILSIILLIDIVYMLAGVISGRVLVDGGFELGICTLGLAVCVSCLLRLKGII